MSSNNVGLWLLSQNSYEEKDYYQRTLSPQKKLQKKAISVAISSGKGGVGKTSVSIKSAKVFHNG